MRIFRLEIWTSRSAKGNSETNITSYHSTYPHFNSEDFKLVNTAAKLRVNISLNDAQINELNSEGTIKIEDNLFINFDAYEVQSYETEMLRLHNG